VTLLTRDFGKLTGIGKGAVRSRRRFPNSLEPLARVNVRFHQRPNASLAFLESCELTAPLAAFAEPAKFAYGSYLSELTDQLTAEGQPSGELYELLSDALHELEIGPASASLLRAFEVQLLACAGYGPRFDQCASCGRPIDSAGPALLHAAHGTFLCSSCGEQANATVVEIGGSVLGALGELCRLPLAATRQHPLGTAAEAAAELTGRLLALHLNRPLRSVKLIQQLAP
jgi:DNA repair protein RecO (recombination protein O)